MENYRKSLIESIEDNKVELVAPRGNTQMGNLFT
jgi:hypothetical protein